MSGPSRRALHGGCRATDVSHADGLTPEERTQKRRADGNHRLHLLLAVLCLFPLDAFAGAAAFEKPDRLAAAPDGTFYVLERERKRLRHVSANGEVLAQLAPNPRQGILFSRLTW